MRFGYLAFAEVAGGGRGTFRALADEARAAERAGFDIYAMTEHHQGQQGEISSPLAWLTALAAVTERIELGPCVALLPLYHPLRLAEETAILDVVSDGRAFLGVGMGYQRRDLEPFGVAPGQRVPAFERSLGFLARQLGTPQPDGDPQDGDPQDGDPRDRGVRVTPTPVRQPVPIWGGATKRVAIERVARRCDGWICGGTTPLDKLERGTDIYVRAATAAGREPRIMLLRDVWLTGGNAPADAAYIADLRRHFEHLHRADGPRDAPPAGTIGADALAGTAIVGDAAHCRAVIAGHAARVPIDTFLVRMRTGYGPPADAVVDAILRFGDEVIGPLRQAAEPGSRVSHG
ncbi:MAG: LLM class flavin-dependent oxidoreductase [Micromonosporaceae bacterium]|nr:LLM class flavin-dependent oxidoreductase [Micromonosporaceae bacterium]